MRGANARRLAALAILAAAIMAGTWRLMAANAEAPARNMGPDVVILRELENEYEPVPFDHLSHAMMAEMWDGCVTCHHHSPELAKLWDGPATPTLNGARTQDLAAEVPACKSCHPIAAAEADIHMPSLKGAYHRQCLNCHKEWMHENACVICHAPKQPGALPTGDPSPGDIVGRMHPPIPEPDAVVYRTRFTPADGGNVLFRHKEHTHDYNISCATCHRRDNCADCHSRSSNGNGPRPLKPGMTWEESHAPCISCHAQNRCRHCHYRDEEQPPRAFHHDMTGQGLDEAHAALKCLECHVAFGPQKTLTCGDAACHPEKPIDYPDNLPGPMAVAPPPPAKADDAVTTVIIRTLPREEQ